MKPRESWSLFVPKAESNQIILGARDLRLEVLTYPTLKKRIPM
jgi:hypothetical protein